MFLLKDLLENPYECWTIGKRLGKSSISFFTTALVFSYLEYKTRFNLLGKYLLFLYLFAVILGVIGIILRKRGKGLFDNRERIEKNKINYMIDYLRKRLPCSKRDCYLSDDDKGNLIGSGYSKREVQKVISKIFDYLRVNYDNLYVCVNYFQEDSQPRDTGRYTTNGYTNQIIININPKYSFEQVMAIICHECCHHFLYSKGVWLDNTRDNEYLTDISTIYLGFGEFMLEGYKLTYDKKITGYNTVTIKTNQLGYLNYFDVKYVYKQIQKIRKQALEKAR